MLLYIYIRLRIIANTIQHKLPHFTYYNPYSTEINILTAVLFKFLAIIRLILSIPVQLFKNFRVSQLFTFILVCVLWWTCSYHLDYITRRRNRTFNKHIKVFSNLQHRQLLVYHFTCHLIVLAWSLWKHLHVVRRECIKLYNLHLCRVSCSHACCSAVLMYMDCTL